MNETVKNTIAPLRNVALLNELVYRVKNQQAQSLSRPSQKRLDAEKALRFDFGRNGHSARLHNSRHDGSDRRRTLAFPASFNHR